MSDDETFLSRLVQAVDASVSAALADADKRLSLRSVSPSHRPLMAEAKLLLFAYLWPRSKFVGANDALQLAVARIGELEQLQGGSGLFQGGDNVESPPDSAFTINDVCDAHEVIRSSNLAHMDAMQRTLLDAVRVRLGRIATRAKPALLAGGVHTPNHRWELTACFARLERMAHDQQLIDRAYQWLAESIDLDEDGQFSERSANYAAYVSLPSLMAIGDILLLPSLHDTVDHALAAILDLIHVDGSVETLHSRRQDQKTTTFSLSPFLCIFRRRAIERGRSDFAWAATRALGCGIADPQTVLTELLLHPSLKNSMPEGTPPAERRISMWAESSLVTDVTPRRELVIYGGSDFGSFGRVRSGLANNPTFLRMFTTEVILESVRLSRRFFNFGPFRSSGLRRISEHYELREHLVGQYYQPLDPRFTQSDGNYELTDEGRFAASMSFPLRETDDLVMDTDILVTPNEDGAEIAVDIDGPPLEWSLELAFRSGGVFEGDAEPINGDDERVILDHGVARYRVGNRAIEFGPGTGIASSAFYEPGQDYDYVDGTDALGGPRAYLTGRSPGAFRLSLVVRDL